MPKNYEIKFPCTADFKLVVLNIYKKFPEFKKTKFYEKVFLLGLNEIQLQLFNNKKPMVKLTFDNERAKN